MYCTLPLCKSKTAWTGRRVKRSLFGRRPIPIGGIARCLNVWRKPLPTFNILPRFLPSPSISRLYLPGKTQYSNDPPPGNQNNPTIPFHEPAQLGARKLAHQSPEARFGDLAILDALPRSVYGHGQSFDCPKQLGLPKLSASCITFTRMKHVRAVSCLPDTSSIPATLLSPFPTSRFGRR